MIKRDKRLHMLLSQDEWAALQALADRDGITASDWVRQRIREHAATLEQKPRKKRKA